MSFHPEDFSFDNYYQKNEKEKIEYCLAYIINKLKDQSISAMVGAGFSKNANYEFPNWSDLLIRAYKKMHPEHKSLNNEEISCLIQIKGESNIAQEYEKFMGRREALDAYIENEILPIQEQNLNLDIHQEFLSLKWCDVITTNWDDVLEKSNEVTQKYTIVTSAKQLKLGNKNRIVKIHGSLRNEDEIQKLEYTFDDCFDHLYIITEQDFSNYHSKHEGFSNFMKVKILENAFCLFGFSGNDNNFRFWIKELKRMMEKGGSKATLNPIFFFDVNNNEYENDQRQFFKNNFIIPLRIEDIYKHINSSKKDLDDDKSPLDPKKMFSEIFRYLKSSTELKSSNNISSVMHNGRQDVLIKIAFHSEKYDTQRLIEEYLKYPIFDKKHLLYTATTAKFVQSLYTHLEEWNETVFLFIERWCTNNFFSLNHLFKEKQVKEIIKKYFKSKSLLTNASEFSNLILKYYRDSKNEKEFERIISKTSPKLNSNLFYSQQCLFFIDNMDCKSLEDTLKIWAPENENNVNPLYVLKKISASLTFDCNWRESSQTKNLKKLFKACIKASENEPQIKYFACLYYKFYLESVYAKEDPEDELFLETFLNEGFDPSDYITCFKNKEKKQHLIPNSKARYSSTISFPIDNLSEINKDRLLNFFEYTGFVFRGILKEYECLDFIQSSSKRVSNLLKFYIGFLSRYGNDSDEDFLRAIVPAILRNLPLDRINFIYDRTLEILKYKQEQSHCSRSYYFLLDEITKRLNDDYKKSYHKFLYRCMFSQNKAGEEFRFYLQKGDIWGISVPFTNFLKTVHDSKWAKNILIFLMKEYSTDPDSIYSGYLSFYETLLHNENLKATLKRLYKTQEVKHLLKDDLKKKAKLSLIAYSFIDSEIKKLVIGYLNKNAGLTTAPILVKTFYSKEIKSQIIKAITDKKALMSNSSEWPITSHIEILLERNDLTQIDIDLIVNTLLKNYTTIKDFRDKGKEYVTFDSELYIQTYYQVLHKYSQQLKISKNAQELQKLLKKECDCYSKEIFSFNWIYDYQHQEFRKNFNKLILYSELLNKEAEILPQFQLIFSKLLFLNQVEFEAIIKSINYLLNRPDKKWFTLISKNKVLIFALIQIMQKFKFEIDIIYDDLFIKEQMKILANSIEKMGFKDDVVRYWKEIN